MHSTLVPTMPSVGRVLLLSLTLLSSSLALRCRLFHEIWEDGRLLSITPDTCHSSKYCVAARYTDPDSTKKNGYSMGCDRVDCGSIEIIGFTGWRRKSNGMTCRKSRDYGKDGEICCCTTDMCNGSTPRFALLASVLSFFLIVHVL
ncbi:unnamed protein product [Caenorhabditis auriculariae]|uniref:UPAR/Ly6 domain-containing protein n=1 Tax=Caenorhabditis auriculariae TaxID=2777116 RepID=A0A8S1GR66_9PELO|nr:unnamed protein product [Caenorhabditis auriculariae]